MPVLVEPMFTLLHGCAGAIGLPLRLCQGSQLPRIDVPRLCDQLDDLVLPQLQELRRQLLKFADHARQRELA